MSLLCQYCINHKLKADPRQVYGGEKCPSCGVTEKENWEENFVSNSESKGNIDNASSFSESSKSSNLVKFQPPPIHKNISNLSQRVLYECERSQIILGGIDHKRKEETAEFWMVNYGHPPDGKKQWGDCPHRLMAYDQTSGCIVGGIHWQNPNTLQLTSTNNGGYISAMAVCNQSRNRGIAKILMVAAIEQIKIDGGCSSHLIVTQFGMLQTPHLEKFYNRVGFIHHPTRFLTKSILYRNTEKNGCGFYSSREHIEGPKQASQAQLERLSSSSSSSFLASSSSLSSPRTGLYILPDIPDNYDSLVFGS